MKSAFIFLAQGFEETEAVTIIDILRRADIHVSIISVTEDIKVTGSHGITIVSDLLFEKIDTSNAEILVLPGGMPGTKNLNAHGALKEQLVKFHTEGKLIAAICAAPLVLGGLGILDGKEAACFPGYEDKLIGAKVLYDPVVVSGNIITSRGPGTALDFSLTIVKILKGSALADDLARKTLSQTW